MDHKTSYVISKHHAWAGSVLLGIILAIRVFFEMANIEVNNLIFVIIGFVIVFYILISLLLTYKHRTGLIELKETSENEANNKSNFEKSFSKDQLKIEKKKVKEKVKRMKKQ